MAYARHGKICRFLFGAGCLFCLLSILSATSLATGLTKEQFRNTLRQSLKSMWLDEPFSPELQKKQTLMKEMIKSGTVEKDELMNLIKEEMLFIVNNYKTTYYTLQEMPEVINALFSPALDWITFKEACCWKVITDQLDKDNPYVVKFGTLAPEGTPWLEVPYKRLVPQIERLAAGTLKLKFYTGGIMGEDPDVLRKMDIGQLDGCGCTAFGVLKASPDASVLMVPNLFKNYDEVDYVYKKMRKQLDQSFAEKGYTCSAIIDTGFMYVFSKRKISSLDDLRKQKAITTMGNIEVTLLEELGVDSIPVATPEVISALSTGMADTFIAPAAWALGMQAYQYINYYIKTPFFYAPGVVLTSENMKAKVCKHFGIPETLEDNTVELIILEISQVEEEWKAHARVYEQRSLEAFEAKCGIKPVTLSPEDKKTFEAASLSVRDKLAGKDYPREMLDEVLKTIEEYRNR